MPTYIALVNLTDQGIRDVKQSPERAKTSTATAEERFGINVKDRYWTMGAYDSVIVFDAPNDEAVTAWAATFGSRGSIRTQTMRAFSADEWTAILAKIP